MRTRAISFCGVAFLSLSVASAQTDIRPPYQGTIADTYRGLEEQLDQGMRSGLERMFRELKTTAVKDHPELADVTLDLDAAAPFDTKLDCGSQSAKTITMGRELRLTLYRIAQANMVVGLMPEGRIDKRTALGSYIMALARIYVARTIEHDSDALAGRAPEPSEFFHLSLKEMNELREDPRFSAEADEQWAITMRALLAHEFGHAISLHCEHSARDAGVEAEADAAGMKLMKRDNGDVFAPVLAQNFLLAFMYYSRFITKPEVAEFCSRIIDQLRGVLIQVRQQARDNPDTNLIMTKRMGISFAALSDPDLDKIVSQFTGGCTRYSAP